MKTTTITKTKYNVYPNVSITITSPENIKKRKSVTIVIDYPDYHHHDFTGFFEVRAYDVDVENVDEKPKVLYFDTMTGCWADYIDLNNGPHGYIDPRDYVANAPDKESM